MRNASARRIKVDAMFVGECFDPGVLFQILRRDILNVVIDGEHWLRLICDARRTDLLELRNHRAGIVMRHHMTRTNRNKIARAHHRTGGEPVSMSSGNFFDKREAHIRTPFDFADADAC